VKRNVKFQKLLFKKGYQMKLMKCIFTLFFALLIQITYAQKYQPLVEEGKYWIYDHHASDPICSPMWYLNTEIRFFEGDTIIASKSYKKLLSATTTKTQPYIEIGTKRTLCLMREDTTERKIYVINQDEAVFPCAEGVEVCLWDFGLKVGDSINNCTFNIFYPVDFGDNNYRVLDSVGYETNRWGMEQKHFYTVGVPIGMCGLLVTRPVSYVEGFGTKDGPILKVGATFFTNYCEGTMEQCNIISSTKDDFESSNYQPKIFPNPSWDRITIQTDYEVKNIEIINHTGLVVVTADTKDLDISILSSGIYYVKVYSRENKLYMGKFIKM
jgi:hypothetical protein